MGSEEPTHSHYWPGDGCIPITPQARRLGWTYPVYVTQSVWTYRVSWKQGKDTSTDKRIFDLLDSCWKGMGKALATEPERLSYSFKHWYWPKDRPKAKKQAKAQLAARLLLDPETEEPWILIFDPITDHDGVLKHGEPTEHREDDGSAGGALPPRTDTPGVDPS